MTRCSLWEILRDTPIGDTYVLRIPNHQATFFKGCQTAMSHYRIGAEPMGFIPYCRSSPVGFDTH